MWDTIKQNNIHTVGVPEGEQREKGVERIFEEIMAENFPHLMKHPGSSVNSKKNELIDTKPDFQSQTESQKQREKQIITYEGSSTRLTDFSSETLEFRRQWDDILKLVKENPTLSTKSPIFSKIVLQSEGEIQALPDK